MLTPEENQRLTVLSRAKPVRSTETAEKLTRAFEELEACAWDAFRRFKYARFALRLAYSEAGEIAPGWLP